MQTPADRTRWRELDLIRTLAVALMVANHAAVRIGPEGATRFIDSMNLIGSMAPVAFFFLTGLGNGIQSIGKPSSLGRAQLIKIGILLAADAFLWISPTRRLGLDFLGFIAMSVLMLKALAKVPRSGLVAIAAAILVLLLRFALGPIAKDHIPETGAASALRIALGLKAAPGFSFPPAPWLVYPLLGYTAGRLAAARRHAFEAHRIGFLIGSLLVGLLAAGASAYLVHRGAPMFRWGTVSIAFFLASLAAVGFALAAASAVARLPWSSFLSTGAQQSFAVVPLHYALLEAFDQGFGRAAGDADYLLRASAALAFSLFGASLLARSSVALKSRGGRAIAMSWILVPAVCLAIFLYLATGVPPEPLATALRSGAQLGLCVLLVLPLPDPY